MKRRAFLSAMAGGLLVAPFAAEAQPARKVYRIGYLLAGRPPAERTLRSGLPGAPHLIEAFLRELRARGWIEGQNIVIDFRFAEGRLDIYSATVGQCRGCPQKHRCTPGAFRKLFVHWEEPARERVRALVDTPAYERSRRDRYKVEALFAELKQRLRVGRVRLRRLWNVAEQFHLAATAQNLKRLVQFIARGQPTRTLRTT